MLILVSLQATSKILRILGAKILVYKLEKPTTFMSLDIAPTFQQIFLWFGVLMIMHNHLSGPNHYQDVVVTATQEVSLFDCAGNKSPYTWEQVLKVLYQPAVGGNRVADELREKYRVP